MPVYNKLVRDRIPEIIKQSGKKCSIRHLAHNEYIEELKKKLTEEFEEYLKTDDDNEALEELADMLEILYALTEVHGAKIEKVEEVRKQKAAKRGQFQEKIFLIEVEDE